MTSDPRADVVNEVGAEVPVRHAVVVATIRRPSVVAGLLECLRRQTAQPEVVVLVVVEPDRDLPTDLPDDVRVVVSEPGLTVQRNTAVRSLPPEVELVTFLDDDAHPADDYLERARRFAEARPDVVLFSGRVVYDGAASGPIERDAAERLLAQSGAPPGPDTRVDAYGCNMNVRADVLRMELFDENFPAYGWLEDRDFAVRCGRHGGVLTHEAARLVHLGVASGRVPPHFLGYSQVANPVYLYRKGILSALETVRLAGHAFLGNVVAVVRRRSLDDRMGRLNGNARAVHDLLRGRLDPARAQL